MRSIPYEDLRELLATFKREALHLELRDAYGTEAELPHLRMWLAGEPDDPAWLQPWFDKVRAGKKAGKSFKRARVVSEPVTDYHRWVLKDAHLFVEAGEDIRWVPRRLVSSIALPGNDFWLFDDELAVFLSFLRQRAGARPAGHDRFCRSPPLPLGLRCRVANFDTEQ